MDLATQGPQLAQADTLQPLVTMVIQELTQVTLLEVLDTVEEFLVLPMLVLTTQTSPTRSIHELILIWTTEETDTGLTQEASLALLEAMQQLEVVPHKIQPVLTTPTC